VTPLPREGFDPREVAPWEVDERCDWPDPAPLPGDGPRPPYPVDSLPRVVRDMVRAVADYLGTPPDLAALVALGVVATAVVGAVEVELRPGWRQPPTLYLVGIAAPGEMKSPMVAELRTALEHAEHVRRDDAAPRVREAETRCKTLRSSEKKAIGRGDQEAALRIAEELAEIGTPTLPHLLVGDATPEALVAVLVANRGRIGYVTDEGGEVFALASRYAASGKANLGPYLTGWDGGPYVVDRIGRGHQDIARTTLVMALLAQPTVAHDVLRDAAMVGRGLAQRFLWCWPESHVGSRPVDGPPVRPEVRGAWGELIGRLAGLAYTIDEPVVVSLSAEARALFREWRARHEPRLGPAGDLATVAEWGSKLPGQVGRIALVLHVAETGTLSGSVSGTTMASALKIAEYHAAHALYTFGVAQTDDATRDASSVLQWAQHRGTDEVTVRDLYTSRDWRPDRARAALQMLCDYGWTRRLVGPRRPGRPSERYQIHPASRCKTAHIPVQHEISSHFAPLSRLTENASDSPMPTINHQTQMSDNDPEAVYDRLPDDNAPPPGDEDIGICGICEALLTQCDCSEPGLQQ